MPGMEFCVEELQANKSAWEAKIADAQARARQDSDDSIMMDGMFSPRAMSVAHPSDASHQKISKATSPSSTLSPDSDLRKVLLSKSPFSPPNGVTEETEQHAHSHPEVQAKALLEESAHPSPNEVVPDPSSRRSSKPSQLQLSYATASAPGLLDHPSRDPHLVTGEPDFNGMSVHSSLVTDAVIVDPPTSTSREMKPTTFSKETKPKDEEQKQRSSDGTEASSSAAGDWTSQATSATTSKMPLSPSTQGTSIMSQESVEKSATRSDVTPKGGSPNQSQSSTASQHIGTGDEIRDSRGDGKSMVIEKVRNLKKRPSRFRMNFWKRSKSASPPIPVGIPVGLRTGSANGRGESEDGLGSG